MSAADSQGSGGAAFRYREFRLYQLARIQLTLAIQMQSVAVGWHLYHLTGRPLDLGLAGLAQFLPGMGLALLTGHVADRFDRRRILAAAYATLAAASFLFLAAALAGAPSRTLYAILVLVGTARAFAGPAAQSLVPELVPPEHFPNAVAWSSTVFQVGTIVGPAVGGVLYGARDSPAPVYWAAGLLGSGAAIAVLAMRVKPGKKRCAGNSWAELVGGIRYVWQHQTILGSISLDLFAVLLGGAVALMPIYAHDILRVGPWGLGVLRSAPAAGAALMAVFLAHRPIRGSVGKWLFGSVAIFGVSTVAFGLSESFALSVAALFVLGASDMVSMVIRLTLVQLATPPHMRGRVSAVNSVFIGASNELGEFESGVTAAWLGTARAVVLGGVGTLFVALTWARLFPDLLKTDRLEETAPPGGNSSG